MTKSKIVFGIVGVLGLVGGVSQAAPTNSVAPAAVNVTPNSYNVTPNAVNVNPNSANIVVNASRRVYPYTYTVLTPNGYITQTYYLPYPPYYNYNQPVPQYNNRPYPRRGRNHVASRHTR